MINGASNIIPSSNFFLKTNLEPVEYRLFIIISVSFVYKVLLVLHVVWNSRTKLIQIFNFNVTSKFVSSYLIPRSFIFVPKKIVEIMTQLLLTYIIIDRFLFKSLEFSFERNCSYKGLLKRLFPSTVRILFTCLTILSLIFYS